MIPSFGNRRLLGPSRSAALLCLAAAATLPQVASAADWKDVRPIVAQRCTPCHQPGGGAAFPLLSPADFRPRVRLVQRALEQRTMPPWLPQGETPSFVGDRRLPAVERDLLLEWLAAGAAGLDDSTHPIEPTQRPTWELGPPDLVLRTDEVSVGATGRDTFRNLVLAATNSPGSDAPPRWVRAVEIRPTRADVVHHAVLTLDRTSSSRKLDAESEEPGFPGMDPRSRAQSPGGQFIGWTPGKSAFPGYDDVAWRLGPTDDLVLLLHLLPRETPVSIQIELGLHFSPEPPTRQVHMLRLGSSAIALDPGVDSHRVTDAFTLPRDATLTSVYPHAHYLAKSMSAWATLPTGTRIDLLDVPQWDFHWQDQYRLQEPLRLPSGTTLHMDFTYANPGRDAVFYGPRSEDEMGDLWLEIFAAEPTADRELAAATARHQLGNLEEGYRQTVQRYSALPPERAQGLVEARFNLADTLMKQGRSGEASAQLSQVLSLDPNHMGSLINLGNLAYSSNRGATARDLFQRATQVDPTSSSAHFNLGNSLLSLAEPQQALEAFDRALELEPSRSAAWLNRGLALVRLGRSGDAVESFLEAAQRDPGSVAAHANVAITLLDAGDLDGAELALQQALLLAPRDSRLLELRRRLIELRTSPR